MNKKSEKNSEENKKIHKPKYIPPSEEELKTMTEEDIYEHRMKNCPHLELSDCLFCDKNFISLQRFL